MSHTPPIPLNHGRKTFAYEAIAPATKLVIFVHGFKGTATGSWGEFPLLMRTDPDLIDADIIFYGYNSTKEQANNNAVRFYEFLSSIHETGLDQLTNSNRRCGPISYSKKLIVAHSLGSIITRRALLFAKGENKQWLHNCKMVLFAPAHKGARLQNIGLDVLPTWGKILAGIGLIAVPIIEDLRPGSQTITNLIHDTESYLNTNDGDFTIAHEVIWAQNELVVHNEAFCNDPAPSIKDGRNHVSVCKPFIPDYADPFEIIKNAL